jgi:hypothetical protein
VIDAFTPYGHALLPIIRERIQIKDADGSETSGLVVLYDPEHGHYLWHITALDDGNSHPADFLRALKAGSLGCMRVTERPPIVWTRQKAPP